MSPLKKKTATAQVPKRSPAYLNARLRVPAILFPEPRKVLPILKTDEPICPEGKLSCGNGECVDKELFCNGKPDCKDESDENACSELTLIFFFFSLESSGKKIEIKYCRGLREDMKKWGFLSGAS